MQVFTLKVIIMVSTVVIAIAGIHDCNLWGPWLHWFSQDLFSLLIASTAIELSTIPPHIGIITILSGMQFNM